MKTIQLILLLTSSLVACACAEAACAGNVDDASQRITSTHVTRAYLLADLDIWRRSGMDDIARSQYLDWPGQVYQDAYARYQTMRADLQVGWTVCNATGPRAREEKTAASTASVPSQHDDTK